ncbi:MAG: OadG family protein [bacterium]|nr:OadG family protein [bacterium]
MGQLEFSFQNVIEGHGLDIAFTGMLIVFTALLLISLFIAALPRILDRLSVYFPEGPEHHLAGAPAPRAPSDETELLAAIGFALHTRKSGQ